MKKLFSLALSLIATVAMAKQPVAPSPYQITSTDQKGTPAFVSGDLGSLGKAHNDVAAKAFLKSQKALLGMAGTEDFDTKSVTKDNLGQTHYKFQQTLKGLPVI